LANPNFTNGPSATATNNIPVKQKLHKANSLSSDRTRFQEFRLFENNPLGSANAKSSLLLETSFSGSSIPTPSTSYWPLTSDSSSNLANKESTKTNSSAPWNSVLLNDFDDFAAPSSLNNSSSGNHIKSLWATTDKSNSNAAEALLSKKKL
jgi:hypothetical protein